MIPVSTLEPRDATARRVADGEVDDEDRREDGEVLEGLRGEEPGPRLESHVPLRLICLDCLFGEYPSGVPFAGEQFDDGEIKQRTGYSWSVVDCLTTVEGKAGIPSSLAQVTGRRTQKSQVSQGQILTATISQLLADLQRLS